MSTSRERSRIRSGSHAGSASSPGGYRPDALPEERQVRALFEALPERRVSERVMQNLAAAARETAAERAAVEPSTPLIERLKHWLGLDSVGYVPAMGWGLAALLLFGVIGHFAALGQLDTVADPAVSAETTLAWDYELEEVYTDWTATTTSDETGITSSYTGLTDDLGDGVGTRDAFDIHMTNLQNSFALLADDIDEF